MEQKATLAKAKSCRHSWIELGHSLVTGKLYRRCARCGLLREENLAYIV